jgi:hypothetical protein
VQRATAQSKTGIFLDHGVAEVPPGFQAGWSEFTYSFSFFLSYFVGLIQGHFERLNLHTFFSA